MDDAYAGGVAVLVVTRTIGKSVQWGAAASPAVRDRFKLRRGEGGDFNIRKRKNDQKRYKPCRRQKLAPMDYLLTYCAIGRIVVDGKIIVLRRTGRF